MDNLATLEVIFDKIKLAKSAQAEANTALVKAQEIFDKAREESNKATAELSALVTQLNTTCGVMTALVATPVASTVPQVIIAKPGNFASIVSANATTVTATTICKPKVTAPVDKSIRHCNFMKGTKNHCNKEFRIYEEIDDRDRPFTFCEGCFEDVVGKGRGSDWVKAIIADTYIR